MCLLLYLCLTAAGSAHLSLWFEEVPPENLSRQDQVELVFLGLAPPWMTRLVQELSNEELNEHVWNFCSTSLLENPETWSTLIAEGAVSAPQIDQIGLLWLLKYFSVGLSGEARLGILEQVVKRVVNLVRGVSDVSLSSIVLEVPTWFLNQLAYALRWNQFLLHTAMYAPVRAAADLGARELGEIFEAAAQELILTEFGNDLKICHLLRIRGEPPGLCFAAAKDWRGMDWSDQVAFAEVYSSQLFKSIFLLQETDEWLDRPSVQGPQRERVELDRASVGLVLRASTSDWL